VGKLTILGKRLKQARKNKGLTQDYVAKILGTTYQTISNYERGIRDPDTDSLTRLANLYEISIDWLLGLTDDPTPPQPKKQEKPNFEEYVLSAPALGEALIRIAELDDEYSMDEPTFADLSQKAFKKFGLSKAKGSDRAAGGIKIPGTGALDD